LPAKFLKHDALVLPVDLLGKYDISMSFGLAEHFRGVERTKIIKSHFDVLKKGGMAFISVPNRYNPPYRLSKFFAEHVNRWRVGAEIPYSRKELGDIC
jgi:2-polyprenyl-3-methyl-5-hydroxy-6-metoxy-1,4-benzoquinol methylase